MQIMNIEGDELCMQLVTSVAKRHYYVQLASGSRYPLHFKYIKNGRFNKTKVQEFMLKSRKVLGIDYTVECDTTYLDFSLVINMLEKRLRKYQEIGQTSAYKIWLGPSDGSNFRFQSAKTAPYKSDRGVKPPLVIELRNYLKLTYGAEEIYGYEADDALGIYQNSSTIAVHCDKDIFMIPGLHLNTMTDKIVHVTDPGHLELKSSSLKGHGLAFFFAQMLMGDRTDTIPPLVRGMGPAKAHSILKLAKTEHDYFRAVRICYNNVLGDNYLTRMREQADLVWICRKTGEYGRDYINYCMEKYGE
jgi:hypothetical protein